MFYSHFIRGIYARLLAVFVLTCFISTTLFPSYVMAQIMLPKPGTMVGLTSAFTPALLKGVQLDIKDPLKFNFIVSPGDEKLSQRDIETEGMRFVRYFMAGLTLPEQALWVNLSPHESDRIIDDGFAKTEMGEALLSEDYILKQLVASLSYPDSDLGKKFWERVYAEAESRLGTTDVSVEAFNKVWIAPHSATIIEQGTGAFVAETRLKVMLERDYAAEKAVDGKFVSDNVVSVDPVTPQRESSEIAAREVLIPILEKEVNEGSHFAVLRQIYNAMVLADWYKKALKESILGKLYADQAKVAGIDMADQAMKDQIYQKYLAAFKTGAYNMVKEEAAPNGDIIPRKYVSGGANLAMARVPVKKISPDQATPAMRQAMGREAHALAVALNPAASRRMTVVNGKNHALEDVGVVVKAIRAGFGKPTFRQELHIPLVLDGQSHLIIEDLLAQFRASGTQFSTEREEFLIRFDSNLSVIVISREGGSSATNLNQRANIFRKWLAEFESAMALPAYVQDTAIKDLRPITATRKVSFGTSGDRGKLGRDFDIMHVRRLAEGTARYTAQEKPGSSILMGYDPREGNRSFVRETAQILAAQGIQAIVIEEAPTPSPVLGKLATDEGFLDYLQSSRKLSINTVGGVVNFTASHNPATDDGFKYSDHHGGAAPSSVTKKLTEYSNAAEQYGALEYEAAKGLGLIVEVTAAEAIDFYVRRYLMPILKGMGAMQDLKRFLAENTDFRLIIDAMEGTGGPYLQALYDAIGQETGNPGFFEIINKDANAQFTRVNGEPRPDAAGSRQGLVDRVKALQGRGMGASVDGDADRYGNVDPDGSFVPSNDLIPLMAYFLINELGVEGDLAKTVATSNFVNAVGRKLGRNVHEVAVGFKNFVELVVDKGIQLALGGEESSHVGVGPFMSSWDDGLVVGFIALWIKARTGKSLAEYKRQVQEEIGQKFLIETINLGLNDQAAFDRIKALVKSVNDEMDAGIPMKDLSIVKQIESLQDRKVEDVIRKDGIKVVFDDGSWLLFRPSGTQVLTKLYVETAAPFDAPDQVLKDRFDLLVSIGQKIAGGAEAAMADGADDEYGIPGLNLAMSVPAQLARLSKPGMTLGVAAQDDLPSFTVMRSEKSGEFTAAWDGRILKMSMGPQTVYIGREGESRVVAIPLEGGSIAPSDMEWQKRWDSRDQAILKAIAAWVKRSESESAMSALPLERQDVMQLNKTFKSRISVAKKSVRLIQIAMGRDMLGRSRNQWGHAQKEALDARIALLEAGRVYLEMAKRARITPPDARAENLETRWLQRNQIDFQRIREALQTIERFVTERNSEMALVYAFFVPGLLSGREGEGLERAAFSEMQRFGVSEKFGDKMMEVVKQLIKNSSEAAMTAQDILDLFNTGIVLEKVTDNDRKQAIGRFVEFMNEWGGWRIPVAAYFQSQGLDWGKKLDEEGHTFLEALGFELNQGSSLLYGIFDDMFEMQNRVWKATDEDHKALGEMQMPSPDEQGKFVPATYGADIDTQVGAAEVFFEVLARLSKKANIPENILQRRAESAMTAQGQVIEDFISDLDIKLGLSGMSESQDRAQDLLRWVFYRFLVKLRPFAKGEGSVMTRLEAVQKALSVKKTESSFEAYFQNIKGSLHHDSLEYAFFNDILSFADWRPDVGSMTQKNLFDQKLREGLALLTAEIRKAENRPTTETVQGGIDLTRQYDLQIRRDENGIPLPVHQQPIEQMRVDGFSAVLINSMPVDLAVLVGFSG